MSSPESELFVYASNELAPPVTEETYDLLADSCVLLGKRHYYASPIYLPGFDSPIRTLIEYIGPEDDTMLALHVPDDPYEYGWNAKLMLQRLTSEDEYDVAELAVDGLPQLIAKHEEGKQYLMYLLETTSSDKPQIYWKRSTGPNDSTVTPELFHGLVGEIEAQELQGIMNGLIKKARRNGTEKESED